jgi:hypothetical protein
MEGGREMTKIYEEILEERRRRMAYNAGLQKAVYILEEGLILSAPERLRLLEALKQEIKDSETDFTSKMLLLQNQI